MKDRIIGPFFFVEATVTGGAYLDMLEQFVYPQVADLQPNIIYPQDGAPLHWSLHVRETITRTFPDRWLGRDGLIPWPPRSPDITPLDFFFLGVRQGPSVCYPCARPSSVTRPHPWCDCLSNSGHVGQNMARNWVQTLSYTTNCIHLAFTVFSQWWTEMWEVRKGHSVLHANRENRHNISFELIDICSSVVYLTSRKTPGHLSYCGAGCLSQTGTRVAPADHVILVRLTTPEQRLDRIETLLLWTETQEMQNRHISFEPVDIWEAVVRVICLGIASNSSRSGQIQDTVLVTLRKTSKYLLKLSGNSTHIRNGHLPNAVLAHYCCTDLFGTQSVTVFIGFYASFIEY
jgi:hypothetical protein